jgi:hypothetical protein
MVSFLVGKCVTYVSTHSNEHSMTAKLANCALGPLGAPGWMKFVIPVFNLEK